MNIKIKFFLIGLATAAVLGLGSVIGLFYAATPDYTMTFHEQTLPSGKKIKVTMCNFVWGVDHSDRYADRDAFSIEYISSIPDASQEEKDREALEVFELIRPISEQWRLDNAEIIAFPSAKRKGSYDIYAMKKNSDNKQWEFTRSTQKVHNND